MLPRRAPYNDHRYVDNTTNPTSGDLQTRFERRRRSNVHGNNSGNNCNIQNIRRSVQSTR